MYSGKSKITVATLTDINRIMDARLLAKVGKQHPADVYNSAHTYYLISYKTYEMFAEVFINTHLSKQLSANVAEVHIACQRQYVRGSHVMCNNLMSYLANEKLVDLIVTDCVPGTTTNMAFKLGFTDLGIDSRDRRAFVYPAYKLRDK